MSTHASVSICNPDHTVDSIYVHSDGYPLDAGKLLFKFYDTEEKVRKLISHGDASFLGDSIENTCFYHRDRGEKLQVRVQVDFEDINNKDYNSLFIDGRWVWGGGELGDLFPEENT